MNEPQRYSGPELGPLLRKVRDELGEDAAIVEANKVRSGGVAGFFTNEHYEVVADKRTGVTSTQDGGTRSPAVGPGPQGAPVSESRAGSLDGRAQDPPAGHTSIQHALLERAEHVSTQEYLSRAAESDSISLGGDDFDSVLNHFLDDDTVQLEARPDHRRRRTDSPRQPPPTHRIDVARIEQETPYQPGRLEPGHPEAPAWEPIQDESPRQDPPRHSPPQDESPRQDPPRHDPPRHDRPDFERPGPDQVFVDSPGDDPVREDRPPPDQFRLDSPRDDRVGEDQPSHDQRPQVTTPNRDVPQTAPRPQRQMPTGSPSSGRRSLLWRSMLSARGWQCPTVAGARVAWFIGPYADVTSVERRFGPREPHDIMHLSPEQDLGPRWATTNSFDEALERCRRWRRMNVAGSIVVDYPADEFDPQLLAELSLDQCDAVHLVTDNLDRMEALIDLCHFAPVPAMVDLIEAPPSSMIGAALDAGLPIASILGMEMTPQLIVAIRIDAVHGEGGESGHG
jgi:hypothetical protein